MVGNHHWDPLFRRHFHLLFRQLSHDNGDSLLSNLLKSSNSEALSAVYRDVVFQARRLVDRGRRLDDADP